MVKNAEEIVQELEKDYEMLISLWSNGVRDYHSLFSGYLTANSIFVAAVLLLFKELCSSPDNLIIKLGILIISAFGAFIAFQMAVALGRFSAQNALIEWRARKIEYGSSWKRFKILSDIREVKENQNGIHDEESIPKLFMPNWALRVHRKKYAGRSQLLPKLFILLYLLTFFSALIIEKIV